jgi:hypothetical protein
VTRGLWAPFFFSFRPAYWSSRRSCAAAIAPLPLAVLELVGLVILAFAAWAPRRPILEGLPATLRWGLALLVLVPLGQLLPVPMAWWAMLPGHGPFAQVLEIAADAGGWRSITVNPTATQYSWLVMIPCAAMFAAVRQLDRTWVRRLSIVFVGTAFLEALIGVVQAGSSPGSAIMFGNPYGGAGATGTYVNKNHFVALIAMALPMLIALWAIEMLPVVTRHGEVLREHPRNADMKFAMRVCFSMLTVGLLLALLLSRSRAGIAAGLLAFALAIVAMVWRAATVQVKVVLSMVVGLALFIGAYVGLTPVLERFAPDVFFDGVPLAAWSSPERHSSRRSTSCPSAAAWERSPTRSAAIRALASLVSPITRTTTTRS